MEEEPLEAEDTSPTLEVFFFSPRPGSVFLLSSSGAGRLVGFLNLIFPSFGISKKIKRREQLSINYTGNQSNFNFFCSVFKMGPLANKNCTYLDWWEKPLEQKKRQISCHQAPFLKLLRVFLLQFPFSFFISYVSMYATVLIQIFISMLSF